MMKYALLLIMLVLVAAVNAQDYASSQVSGTNPSLYVVEVNSDPSPATPGDYVDLWLRVENRGTSDATNVFVTIPRQDIFSAAEATQSLGKLGPSQSAVAYFRVRVASDAPSGPAQLRVELQRYAADTPEIAEVTLQVKSIDAVLAIDSVVTIPETVAPGETMRIDVTLRNKADTVLRSIRAQLKLLTQVTTTTGISTLELPFTPMGSGTEKTIDSLAPGKSETVSFTLMTNPDAENRPYKIPLSILYYDPTGANRTRDEVVGVIVGSDPELSVYVDSTELTSDVSTGEVIIRFVNRGVSDVKFLTVRLDATEEYVIVSAPEAYVGKIDSDDYETAEFKLALTRKANDLIELPLVMEYRDGNNKKYSNGMTLSITRYTPAQLGVSGGSFGIILIVLLVLGVGSWWAYRRFRKKR